MSDARTDPGWIQAAVEQYERPLTLYALRVCGDVERARDAVQETFLRLCKENPTELEGHLAEWLYRVCRTRALDVQRKEKRMSPLTEVHERRQISTAADPHDAIEQQESSQQMLKTLEGLPENQQEVIRLKFQHGLSYREIAKVTQLSVTNVGFLIHTGLKTLRLRMTEPQGLGARA